MPTKRRFTKQRQHRITPELRPMAERLLELKEAHMHAIQTGERAFYDDGRHEELVNVSPIVHRALEIKPWDDGYAILREALEEFGAGSQP